MLLVSNQNYNDAFIVKKTCSFKCAEASNPGDTISKNYGKIFLCDLKRKMKNTYNPMPIGSEFKNASEHYWDNIDNIETNARTL